MKPEVAVILLLNLLPLQSLALLIDTPATGSETSKRDARMKNLHPVGATGPVARRKRSLPAADDADYRNSDDGSRFRGVRLAEPNIAERRAEHCRVGRALE